MSSSKDKSEPHSKDLLRLEANMSDVPRCFQLKAEKLRPSPGMTSTFRPPPSTVLQQVRSFLPLMAKANQVTEDQMRILPPGALDIEQVDDTDSSHIQMDIALVERDESDSDSSILCSDLSDLDDTSDEDEETPESNCDCSLSLSTNPGKQTLISPADIQDLVLPGQKQQLGANKAIKVLSDGTGVIDTEGSSCTESQTTVSITPDHSSHSDQVASQSHSTQIITGEP